MSHITLTVGMHAPGFSLPNQDGKTITLSDLHGKWVLLYFYPKDDTPGCTTEACSLRDAFPRFTGLDAVVLGVSTDSVASHKKFHTKHMLPFDILADSEKQAVAAYGVYGLKKFMGREYLGTQRVSFLIDPHGNIAAIYPSVKPAEHAAEVAADIENMRTHL